MPDDTVLSLPTVTMLSPWIRSSSRQRFIPLSDKTLIQLSVTASDDHTVVTLATARDIDVGALGKTGSLEDMLRGAGLAILSVRQVMDGDDANAIVVALLTDYFVGRGYMREDAATLASELLGPTLEAPDGLH